MVNKVYEYKPLEGLLNLKEKDYQGKDSRFDL